MLMGPTFIASLLPKKVQTVVGPLPFPILLLVVVVVVVVIGANASGNAF